MNASPIAWLTWSADAFARAAREGKPVLLSITAAWCRACREMDRVTYADPRIAALVGARFVPVRVDTDHRPDINERYNVGGWPTTAFLTPEGDVIGGGTFMTVERMPGILMRVAEAFTSRAQEIAAARASAGPPERLDGDAAVDPGALIASIFASYDEEFGGFGIEPKFPHTAALHLAIALYRDSGDDRWRGIVERTLDAMADGGLWDGDGGGFHRYAASRDWQLPRDGKLLDTNALLLRAYAEAAAVFQRESDRARCAAIARFITSRLRAEGGGYFGSDADRILYADANGAAAGALLAAGAVLGDRLLIQEALTSFERVVLACYKPGAGVAHYFDDAPRVRGLLADQVSTIVALLDAHDITGGEPYVMMAEEIGHFLVRELWDDRGGFFDRAAAPDDIGLLRTRRKPFVANAEAALACARLDRAGHAFDFGPHAAGALAVAAREAPAQGPLAAHYVLAARHVHRR